MSIYDDRLTALEKTLALFQRDEMISRDELNRNTTMLLGMVSTEQLNIKEVKVRLLTIDDRLSSVDQRMESHFETLEKQLKSVEQHSEQRFTSLESRFDRLENQFEQVLQQLASLTTKLDQEK